jgi:membrane protein YqaA with SNARE-associated domain
MTNLPPSNELQSRDAEHLRILAICHVVVGVLAVAAIGFLALHYVMMHTFFDNPELWKNGHGTPPPKEFIALFAWFYVIGGVMCVLAAAANLASAYCIHRRTCRTLSLVVAGCDCLQFPFGTALGVFTLITLTRDSVKAVYAQADPPPAR